MREDFLPVLLGPTAVGKTELSVELAKALNAEILSADSMQIYRGMDIGTAKPTSEERQGVPHHLIDLVAPDTLFTVADYQKLFEETVREVRGRGKVPLVVGGTGLYIRAVTRRFRIPGPASDPDLREKLRRRADAEGNERLFEELRSVDPVSAGRIHPNDRRRIIRALEVFYSSGRTFSDWLEDAQEPLMPGTVLIGLSRERSDLYRRIDQRVDTMIKNGLLEEVEKLLKMGYSPKLPSMQGLGYKELIPVLNGEQSLQDAVEILKKRTRHYAKRQISWFKREPVVWFAANQERSLLLRKILCFLEGVSESRVE